MHSKGYVEDLLTMAGRKRCAKMISLNLSVLPLIAAKYRITQNRFPRQCGER